MRIKLRHFLLIFPAFFLGMGWHNHWNASTSNCSRWSFTQSQISGLQLRVLHFLEYGIPLDDLENYFAGQLPPNHPLVRSMNGLLLVDPWGNPIRFVRLREEDENVENRCGIYSTGADGVSSMAGNDPDDISSWAQGSTEYYQDQDRMANMTSGLIYTPFSFAGLIGLDWLLTWGILRGRRANHRCSIADDKQALTD